MHDQLRHRAIELLAHTKTCTLATGGPAGVQASTVPCAGHGLDLVLLVPDTADHLFNLEREAEVALVGAGWHLRGTAQVLDDIQSESAVFSPQQLLWHKVVRVIPIRMVLISGDGYQSEATLDFDDITWKEE